MVTSPETASSTTSDVPSEGGSRKGRVPRLFVVHDLATGVGVPCDVSQRNYLINVLRLGDGAGVLVFNGRDGEWFAHLRPQGRKVCALEMAHQVRPQVVGCDLTLAFAPLKRARVDYMVQKATELGVRALTPVMTAHAQVERIKLDRMRANVVEAAEQCGVLNVPEVHEPQKFAAFLAGLPSERLLIFCDEAADVANPLAALEGAALPATVLIGPEGGFSESERRALLARENHVRISLGPRIMRADTAAVAALALVNATLGDWR